MEEWLQRTEMLVGKEAVERLQRAHVAIFGIGGVGGYVAEALARSGVGCFDLIDKDVVSVTNINRQIIATTKTLGQYKTEVMRERIQEINPKAAVFVHNLFFLPETEEQFDFSGYDYVVDAVDTVTAKIRIIEKCKLKDIPVISSMGAGNKLHPEMFELADISKTSVCPLAKVMRRELKKHNISELTVVFSKEEPRKSSRDCNMDAASSKPTPGSIAFVPSVAGLILASEVVRQLCKV